MLRQMDAAMWAVYGWHGITPDSRQARFMALPVRSRDRRRRVWADRLYSRARFNAFEINESKSKKYFHELVAFEPTWVYGIPNLILRFVEYCIEAGLDGTDLGIQTVVCTGELLTDCARSELQAFFGARVVNEYGCSESGILSFECELGTPHLVPWAVHIEPDINQEEETGRAASGILLTDLFGESFPLLRYRLADTAELKKSSCRCGRNLGVLRPTGGRQSAVIQMPDGREVFSSILAYSVPPEVRRFCARQVSRVELRIEVEPKPGIKAGEAMAAAERSWTSALPGMPYIRVRIVDQIESEASGKLRYFIPLGEDLVGHSEGS
jgi:phenylacetate-CoA ligase